MTPEEHRMLTEALSLAQENARILKNMQRVARASLILRAVYWVVILGLSFGAFYFIQPYIDALKGSTADAQDSASSIDAFSWDGALKNIQEIKDMYK